MGPWAYLGFSVPVLCNESLALGHGPLALYQNSALDFEQMLGIMPSINHDKQSSITLNQSLALDYEQMLNLSYSEAVKLDTMETLKCPMVGIYSPVIIVSDTHLSFGHSIINWTIQHSWTPNYDTSWWHFFQLSPLLEIYARLWFSMQQIFVFVPQRHMSSVKCQEISLHLRRNIFTKHDFAVYINKLKGGLLLVVNMFTTLATVVRHHILAFQLACCHVFVLAWHLVKAASLPIGGPIIVYHRIKLWWSYIFISRTEKKSRSKSVRHFSALFGGGVSNVFTLDELAPYLNNMQSYLTFARILLQTGS
jgi:hypothetical protein